MKKIKQNRGKTISIAMGNMIYWLVTWSIRLVFWFSECSQNSKQMRRIQTNNFLRALFCIMVICEWTCSDSTSIPCKLIRMWNDATEKLAWCKQRKQVCTFPSKRSTQVSSLCLQNFQNLEKTLHSGLWLTWYNSPRLFYSALPGTSSKNSEINDWKHY